MERIRSRYTYRLFVVLNVVAVATILLLYIVWRYAVTAEVGVTAVVATVAYLFLLHLGLLGIVIGGDVATELRQLTDAAEAIGNKNLDVDPQSSRSDEVGQLADSLRSMRDSLREAFNNSA